MITGWLFATMFAEKVNSPRLRGASPYTAINPEDTLLVILAQPSDPLFAVATHGTLLEVKSVLPEHKDA